MKLYYKPGACSLATHIVLYELLQTKQLSNFEISAVDTKFGVTHDGKNYLAINPKGYVPALQLPTGEVITEGVAILQYLGDVYPDTNLVPAAGTLDRARLQESLNYMSSELHKAFSPLFSDHATTQEKNTAILRVTKKLDFINQTLSDQRAFIVGDHFTVADAYLFVIVSWCDYVGIDVTQWPFLYRYITLIQQRDTVKQALRAEKEAS